jgi:PAS domain S-box-containing protein
MPRILYAEPEGSARHSRASTLRAAGFEVLEATACEEACGPLLPEIDVVVLGASLPGASWLDLCRRLEDISPAEDVGVLSLTHSPEQRVLALTTGADAALVEPVDDSLLVAQVSSLVRRRAVTAACRRESEENARSLQAIMDGVPAGIAVADREGCIRTVSRFGLELTGRSLESLQAHRVPHHVEGWGLYRPDGVHRPSMDELPLARALAANETVGDRELLIKRPDGSARIVLGSAAPTRDREGRLTGAVMVWQDITGRKQAEEVLRGSEERLRLAMAAAKGGTYVFDLEQRCLVPSIEAVAIYGLPPGTRSITQSELLEQYILREDHPTVLGALARSASDGTYRVEYRVRTFAGTIRRLASFAKYHSDKRHLVGFVMDVTEQRVAEERLRHSQALLAEAEALSHTGAWEWDVAADRWSFSDEWLRIHGCRWHTMSAAELLAIAHPEDWPLVSSAFDRARAGTEPYDIEHRIVRQDDGAVRDVRARGQFVLDTAGRVSKVFGFVQDVTDQKVADAEIRKGRAELEAVIQAVSDGILVADPAGHVVLVNDAQARILGYTSANAVRESLGSLHLVFELLDMSGRPIALRDWPIARVLEGESLLNLELRARRLDTGESWIFSISGSPVRDTQGRLVLAVVTTRDITGSHRAEEALRQANARLEEADRRKDEFIAVLSHELRNPLAPVRYALPLLQAEPVSEKTRRALAVIDRQVGHLTRLVDDLLDVSRISRGKIELKREIVSLSPILTAAVEAASPAIIASRHELTTTIADEPIWLNADAARLAQVVTNLLNNSARYTPRGGAITLAAARHAGEVVIRVSDNGIGIAPDALDSVFDMFHQGRAASTSQAGLGIGLALSKMLVELHGGTIEARSDGPGHGAEFVVRLLEAAAETPVGGDQQQAVRPGRKSLRVLVVDDNADLVEMLSAVVEGLGHEVRRALDGQSAIAAALAFRPDVVLLDLGLPVVSGLDVARRLRGEPALRATSLVALTGWGQAEDRRQTRDAGFDFHLTKPTEPAALARLLSDLAA